MTNNNRVGLLNIFSIGRQFSRCLSHFCTSCEQTLTAHGSQLSFQGWLYNEQPWKTDIASPPGAKRADLLTTLEDEDSIPLQSKVQSYFLPIIKDLCSLTSYSLPVMQLSVCAASIWPHLHHPTYLGAGELRPTSYLGSFGSDPGDLCLLPATRKWW